VMAVQIYISSGPLAVCVKLDFLAWSLTSKVEAIIPTK
jgi:hypothetical protein